MNRLKKYVLPGKKPSEEIGSAIAFGAVWVLVTDIPGFFMDYMQRLEFMQMAESSIMNFDFANIMKGALFGAIIYSFYRICKAIYDMGYFKRITKSIYVMRRLDESVPIAKRAWTKALIGIAATFLAAVIMFAINYLIYRYGTPEAYLPDTYNIDFWGAIL